MEVINEFSPEDLEPHPLSREVFGDLPEEEYQELQKDIARRGIQDPVQVIPGENGTYTVVCGHQRVRAARELGIKVPCIVREDLRDDLDIREHLIRDNLTRRHLTDYQRGKVIEALYEVERQRARERQELTKLAGRGVQKKDIMAVQNFAPPKDRGKTRDNVAASLGISGWQAEKILRVHQEAPDPIKEKWKRGEITTHDAYESIRRLEELDEETRERAIQVIEEKPGKTVRNAITEAVRRVKHERAHLNPPDLPEGVFDVVYADPPWPFDDEGYRHATYPDRRVQKEYPTMTFEEIKEFGEKIPVAEDAVLFLWAPPIYLGRGYAAEVAEAWGFEPVAVMSWKKPRMGVGNYVRYDFELLLIAKRGQIPTPLPENRPQATVEAPRGRHSEKPEVFYGVIEKMYPNRKYLELFARKKRVGWVAWGNEAL
jgi:ParB/RepB/Spo0J family partition protein